MLRTKKSALAEGYKVCHKKKINLNMNVAHSLKIVSLIKS